jgi:flagellar motor switch protein FliG
MPLTGKQKAAMLLMSLDVATAAEMLKGLDPEKVTELAVELSYLDATGLGGSRQSAEIARQFYSSLRKGATFRLKSFLKDMLTSTLGREKAEQVQTQIQDLLTDRDPFMPIRSAELHTLASVLENEHPQAVAVVLSEMPAKAGSELLGLLSEGIRLSAISRITNIDKISTESKTRIAETIRSRLKASTANQAAASTQANAQQSLRKVAVILRNLSKEVRDSLLSAIQEKDNEMGKQVTDLMIVWEDVTQIADRSLQEALRGVDERTLVLALYKTDEAIIKKIKSNISQRTAGLIDEETALMSTPKKEDIKQAREKIINNLRQMNSKGELAFVED